MSVLTLDALKSMIEDDPEWFVLVDDGDIIDLLVAAQNLHTAAGNFINNVHRQHPGEKLKCPFVRALKKAVDGIA